MIVNINLISKKIKKILNTLKNPPLVCTVGGNDRLDSFDQVIVIG